MEELEKLSNEKADTNTFEINQPPVEQPREFYRFTFNEEEVKRFYKNVLAPRLIALFIIFISYTAFNILLILDTLPYFGVPTGISVVINLFLALLFFSNLFATKKGWKTTRVRLQENTYQYAVYEQYFLVEVFRAEVHQGKGAFIHDPQFAPAG